MSAPLALAALGGVYSERSGVVNIGLEGMMLMGAFGYVLGTHASASPWIGLMVGITLGGGMGLLHALASITFRADQIVSGVSIYCFSLGNWYYRVSWTQRNLSAGGWVELLGLATDWIVFVRCIPDTYPCDYQPDRPIQNSVRAPFIRSR